MIRILSASLPWDIIPMKSVVSLINVLMLLFETSLNFDIALFARKVRYHLFGVQSS